MKEGNIVSVSINIQNQNEEQLVHNLAFMSTPCLLIDHSGRIIGCNKHFLKLSRCTAEGLLSCNFYQHIVTQIDHVDQLQAFTAAGKTNIVEWQGEACKQISQIRPFFIPYEHNPKHYVYIEFLEITDIGRLRALFANQLVSSPHLALLFLDPEGEILHLTESATEILGGDLVEYVGKSIFEYFASRPANQHLLQKSFIREVSVSNKALIWHNGQEENELIVDSFPLYDQEQKWVALAILIKDITSVRALDDHIRRKDRLAMIGQVAAGTAHEIRNPLTSIKGFLQVMKKTLEDHHFTREVHYTEIMLEEIERINHLLGEFLLLSRSKETKYEIISLTELMKQFLPLIGNDAELKKIIIEHHELEELPLVIGNRDLLKQVFLNICKNALEAIKVGGKIQISYQHHVEQKMIGIEFTDDGPGIPSYIIDRIFDPFFTTKEEGTGLGLSVCHRIIHDMGGEIGVRSTNERTVFEVMIPYVES